MKKVLIIAVVALVSSIGLQSCKKYEEGPGFALSSKKARLANEWKVTTMKFNGDDQDLSNWSIEVDILKDLSYETRSTITSGGFSFNDTTAGTWDFSDDNMQVIMTEAGETEGDASTITMLKSKEVRMYSVDSNGDTTTMYLTPIAD